MQFLQPLLLVARAKGVRGFYMRITIKITIKRHSFKYHLIIKGSQRRLSGSLIRCDKIIQYVNVMEWCLGNITYDMNLESIDIISGQNFHISPKTTKCGRPEEGEMRGVDKFWHLYYNCSCTCKIRGRIRKYTKNYGRPLSLWMTAQPYIYHKIKK